MKIPLPLPVFLFRTLLPRRLSRSGAVAAALLISFSGNAAAFETGPEVKLQLKWRHQFQFAGYYAAEKLGYYDGAGLKVEIREGGPAAAAVTEVLAGNADFGVGDLDVLLARLGGKPLVACAAVFQHSPYALMSRADLGIRKPSDLAGRTVMVESDSGAEQVRMMLRREGIDPGMVRLLPHSRDLRDLVESRVDVQTAYVTVGPYLMRAAGAEPSLIHMSDYGVDFYGDALFTSEKRLAADREKTTAFVRASLRGWSYAMAHQEELIAHILTLPGVTARGSTRASLLAEATAMEELVLHDLVDVGHMNAGRWERMAAAFLDSGAPASKAALDGFLFDAHALPSPDSDPADAGNAARVAWMKPTVTLLSFAAGIFLLWTFSLRKKVDVQTRELRLSGQKLGATLNNTLQQLCLLTPDGRLVEANRAALRFVGLRRSEVLGRLYQDTPWWSGSGETAWALREAFAKIMDGASSVEFEILQTDCFGRPRSVDFSLRPVHDSEGLITFIVAEGCDITDRKEAEQALRMSEARLSALVENTDGAIWSVDRTHRYITFNSHFRDSLRAVRGRSPELGGHAVDPPPPGGDARDWAAHYDRALNGERFTVPFTCARPEATRFFETSFNPIVSDGEVTGVSVFRFDVTGQRQLEEKLRQSQKMEAIGQLAGGVAHDFNNLLTVIQGNAALMRHQRLTPESAGNALSEILSASERAAGLTRQLLTFSRQQPMRMRALEVNEMVLNLSRMLRRLIGEHIRLETKLTGNNTAVLADCGMLEQVLLNLAVNARDAMPGGGSLTIRTETRRLTRDSADLPAAKAPGRFLRIDAADTGSGIPPESLPHIFEPFFTTKEVGKGTGLGLATVFGIVEQHGGWITVDSAPGKGAVFSVWLPATGKTAAAGADPPTMSGLAESELAAKPGCETILLVEDEDMVRLIAKLTLTRHGYRVYEAGSGRAALDVWEKHRDEVDLLLTDVVMPDGVSGHDLAKELQARKPSLKVVYSSGYTAEIFGGERGVPEGVAFLGKPYMPEQLLREVRRALDADGIVPVSRAVEEMLPA